MYMTTGNSYTYSMIITNYANRIYVAIMNTDLNIYVSTKTVTAAKASHMYVHTYVHTCVHCNEIL